jgi:transposase
MHRPKTFHRSGWPSRWRSRRGQPSTRGAESNHKNSAPAADRRPDREALGRSRGGLTTKIHLIGDRRCRPLSRVTTAGQRHDSLAFQPLMNQLRIGRLGPGTPRTRPGRLLADKAYSNKKIRSHLRRRGIKATIPEPADQIDHRHRRGSKGGRPPKYDATIYRDRNTIERTINKLRAYRAVAMRTDKRDFVYRGTIDVATIRIWLRNPNHHDPRDTP